MNEILDSELNSAFVAPEREFCGEKLAPYTEGSRLLLMQSKSEEDSSIFFVWAFVYLHIQLAKNRKEAIRLSWNKELFREKVLDWADTKAAKDRDAATNLVGDILEEAARGIVEPIKTGLSLGNA
jgi:hypothetical protein